MGHIRRGGSQDIYGRPAAALLTPVNERARISVELTAATVSEGTTMKTTRRELLKAGLYGIGIGASGLLPVPPLFARAAQALGSQTSGDGRILVVLELSGGNDGLNTVVPYGDDAYYRARPRIGIKPARLRKLDDHFAFQYTMAGLERLYKDGHMAIVHGVGYEQPSFSHFSSMAYWQTAAPNRGDLYGWVGRMAPAPDPGGHAHLLV